ncbi:MAG TPA: hypothetical protein VKU82_12215, partial [Planctomycetaceae bacterium]|nr:hypothetical protein [Planctomycetaceae bacterium]
MTALFVLCAGEPGAWAKPLENDKESKDTPTGETAESGPPTLTIKAVIDGRDELRVSREGLDWIHHDWDWPKGVTINKRSWNPQQQPKLKNESTGRFLPADVNFADPELVVVKGRGKVTLRKESADVVVVQLHDTEGGSDEYEVTIKFRDLPWLLKGTPQLPIAKADEMYSGDLRVVATIDGADELRIYRDRAEWQHQGSNWPSSVKINGSEWPVKQQPRLENAAPNQLLPDWTVLVGAKHWVLRGRGTVEFAIHPDHLALQFNDFDPGGDVYDVVVHQGETFTQLEIADADRQQIADLAAKASQAPHPADRNAPTRSDFDELRRRWRLTRFVAAYEQHGHREKAWDDAALEFLKRAAKYPEEPAAPMIAAGDRLIDLGCDDALVCYVHGWNLTRQKQYAKAEPFVLHAVLGFEKSQYPARSKRCAPALLARLCVWQSSDRSNLAYALFQRAVEETAQAIADPMIEGEPRALLAELRDDLSQEARGDLCDHEPALLRALAVKEQADPWIEHVLLASYQHRQGWQGRGDGFANTVSEEGWQLYYRFLLQARAHLVAAWRLHPEFPEAAVEMIMTNRAVGGIAEETPRFWFDQAVAAQIDAPRAHSQFLWAIRPRWGGSH